MALLDAYGRPIKVAELKSEQAAPTVRGVRQPYGGHPANSLTPVKLARILRDSIDGDPEAYLELAEDMEERDLHYAGVLGIRKRQVAGLDVTVEAASDDVQDVADADLVREVTGRDEFQDELFDILDAVGKGFSPTEILWDTSEGQWRPKALKWRDPRWFVFDPVDGETLLLRDVAGNEPLKPYGWIVHHAKVKSGLPIRGGIARAAAWSYLFKSFTAKDWAIFCEAYGQPLRLGKYDGGASEADKDKLLAAVANIGADFAAIVPQSMAIEFVKAEISGSHELYEKRSDWLDRQVSKLVLGQTGTTDAIAGGYAVGKVHDGVREDIERADARQLAATLNRDLLRPLIDLNFGPRKRYPRIVIGRPDEIDVDKLVVNVAKLVPLGLKVGMSTMRDKLGLPDPGKDEELLGAPPATQALAEELKGGAEESAPSAPERPGTAAPAATAAQRADVPVEPPDAIDAAIEAMLDDEGWQAMVAPMVAGLEDSLATATSESEAVQILAAHFAAMDVSVLTEQLARAAFAARLAGELDEPLSDGL